jgi:hypothetical protein
MALLVCRRRDGRAGHLRSRLSTPPLRARSPAADTAAATARSLIVPWFDWPWMESAVYGFPI